jgi:hypothetical protein
MSASPAGTNAGIAGMTDSARGLRASLRRLVPASCLALVWVLGRAQGQDFSRAEACTTLADDAARLSCYDAALRAKGLAPSAAKPQISPPPDAVQDDVRTKFGDDGRLHTESKPKIPKQLSARVEEVAPLAAGLYRLRLDNGQVWSTTEADSALVFKANDTVTISKGVLGGYQISLASHTTSVKVTRQK